MSVTVRVCVCDVCGPEGYLMRHTRTVSLTIHLLRLLLPASVCVCVCERTCGGFSVVINYDESSSSFIVLFVGEERGGM